MEIFNFLSLKSIYLITTSIGSFSIISKCVFLYIDLRDKSLKRKGIKQIYKDFDNEELRYSIRSILENIPWIRKIFILMPNEKVRYFKPANIIKEKIVYIKFLEIPNFSILYKLNVKA